MGKKVEKRESIDKKKLNNQLENKEKKDVIDKVDKQNNKTESKEKKKTQNLNNKASNKTSNKQNDKPKNKTNNRQDNKVNNNKTKKDNIDIKDTTQEKIIANKQNKSSNKNQIKNVSNEKEIKKEPKDNLIKNNENINIEKEEKKSNKEEDLKKLEVNSKKNKGIKIKIIIVILIFVILVILGISTIPAIITNNNKKIVSGISINGVNVEGLTIEEAKTLLNKSADKITSSDVKIVLGEYENSINLTQISAKYDIDSSIDEAYKIGRKDNIFKNSYDVFSSKYKGKDLDIGISINQEELKNVFNNISQELPGHVIQWSYSVNNDNTLIITNGTKGVVIDEVETTKKIEEALLKSLNGEKIENIDLVTREVEPEPINVEKIHQEVYREPQNAYVTQNPFGVYVHVNGVDFNVDEVKNLISSNEHEYKINLTITEPEVKTKDLGQEAFPDVLGRTYKTTYSAGDKNRNTNIEIAARTVNGIILMPGETFSYNGILGDTTADKGYKPAGAYLNGEVIQSYGGGICQVSSTIYNAVLYANLQVDERYNHTYLSGYVPAGLDATVSYGSKDFKFTNNRNYPIKLVCTAGNGTITATIYGIKQDDDCEVELQSVVTSYISPKVKYEKTNTLNEGVEKVKQAGSSGCKCTVYRTLKRNGEQISKDVLHNDIYSAKQKIILKGTKKAGN